MEFNIPIVNENNQVDNYTSDLEEPQTATDATLGMIANLLEAVNANLVTIAKALNHIAYDKE